MNIKSICAFYTTQIYIKWIWLYSLIHTYLDAVVYYADLGDREVAALYDRSLANIIFVMNYRIIL